MTRVKLLQSAGSQTVSLPEEARFEGEEVLVFREGDRVILEPVRRRWSQKFLDLAGSSPDFPDPEEPSAADPGPDFE